MFEIIKNVINSKNYKLEDILYKIDKMYIQDRISEEEKSELEEIARLNAKAEKSYDIQKQIEELFRRVETLEKNDNTENPEEETEEYPLFKQPIGSHDSYNTGDKITFNSQKYICMMNNCVWSPDAYPAGWKIVEQEA